MTDAAAGAIVSVYAVFADVAEACRIGGIAVEERLAACANVLGPCHSIYRWQGKVEVATEAAAIFKARADKADALIARIAELHSYDVPAIIVWPIGKALPAYADWLNEEG
jgi:periplasmic divalent cation tolerance protein